MRLLVAADASLSRTPDGKYWSPTIYDYSFFERYLRVFEKIVLVSRVKEAAFEEVEGFLRCDGEGLTVAELPDMHGMTDYFKKFFPFSDAAKKAVRGVDCAVIRVPSVSASLVLHYFKKTKKKYFLEVVADPDTVYAYNRPARRFFTRLLKNQCLKADGVSYVTKDYLQSKYPSYIRARGNDGKHCESYFSTIRLSDDFFSTPRCYHGKKSLNIIHVSNSINNELKGHIELLSAAEMIFNKGYEISVTIIGDGSYRRTVEEFAAGLQIGKQHKVEFTGLLFSADQVRQRLLDADMMVFPTYSEGLPRTVIEAMAVGLPVISTPVGGIPELLDAEDLFEHDDVSGISNRIGQFIEHPDLMEKKSVRNIEKAREYAESVLAKRRDEYYTDLKNLSLSEKTE